MPNRIWKLQTLCPDWDEVSSPRRCNWHSLFWETAVTAIAIRREGVEKVSRCSSSRMQLRSSGKIYKKFSILFMSYTLFFYDFSLAHNLTERLHRAIVMRLNLKLNYMLRYLSFLSLGALLSLFADTSAHRHIVCLTESKVQIWNQIKNHLHSPEIPLTAKAYSTSMNAHTKK